MMYKGCGCCGCGCGCFFKNLSSVNSTCVGVNAGTLPVTCNGFADVAAPILRRAAGRDLDEDRLDADAHEATLACERCERDNAEPELGLEGERRKRGGSMRSEAREQGSECEDAWGVRFDSLMLKVGAAGGGW